MNVAATTREYLVLRISRIRELLKSMQPGSSSYDIGIARIEELKSVSIILNGGLVPEEMEVSNED